MLTYTWLIIFATTLSLINLLIPKVTSSFEADKITSLPGQPSVKFQQFAGYISVDETQERNLFYYFVEAENNPSTKPLVLWLNGGPGCSSVGAGAFSEHGPFRPSGNALIKNNYSWNKEANMLYLESPAGVGFSYSTNKSFYDGVNDEMTAKDNLVFLQKWLAKYPEYKNRDFFITGESYGGHYVPQLANLVLKSNLKSNLKGIALGNPLLEFNTDFNSRTEYLWSHGLISDATYELSQKTCNFSQIRRQTQKGSLTPPCTLVNSQLSSEIGKFIDSYDVTLDVCYHSPSQQAHHILTQMVSPLSKGEQVKKTCDVVQMSLRSRKRQPNMVCRIEGFGRVCEHFDERRRRWVGQMGFGGLLHLAGMSLPRTLCYWLMTRVDPFKGTLVMNDGVEFGLNANQVRWVLGVPMGGKVIPRRSIDDDMKMREGSIMSKFGLERNGVIKGTGKEIHSRGVTITTSLIKRLKGDWCEDDEEEFKMSFLLFSLYMVLCPTQSVCLESDLIPALTLASRSIEYDWCSLVLEKLMCSVKRFSKKFDTDGYVGGCGGCSIFVAVYYLDRLDRTPVQWGVWPRIKAWNMEELRKGSRDDRLCCGGDFGKLKAVMASYGKTHPFDSGDMRAPEDLETQY